MIRTGVHISQMSGKLEGFQSISTNTLSNPFCQKMEKIKGSPCQFCYSFNMMRTFRQSIVGPLQHNSEYLSSHIMNEHEIPRILDAYFRFSSHGELINLIHFTNYVLITIKNPHCTFALWTKRKDIVKKYTKPIPENMILVYSNPRVDAIMKKPPKGFHKTFNNVSPGRFLKRQNCTGQKCKDCLTCYKHGGTTTIVEAMK